MSTSGRAPAWIILAFAMAAFVGSLATLFRPDWLEALLPWEPDNGSGLMERAISAGFGLLAGILAVAGTVLWRRATRISLTNARTAADPGFQP